MYINKIRILKRALLVFNILSLCNSTMGVNSYYETMEDIDQQILNEYCLVTKSKDIITISNSDLKEFKDYIDSLRVKYPALIFTNPCDNKVKI